MHDQAFTTWEEFYMGFIWLTRLLGWTKKINCNAMLKQTTASAKEMEWRHDCFLPQCVILSTLKTNSSQSYFAEITSVNDKCLAAAPTSRWIIPEWKHTKNFFFWVHKTKKGQFCLFATCFSLNHKKINEYKHGFLFTWTIKIQSGDQIIHKTLCLLDTNMGQYFFNQIQKLIFLYFELYRLHRIE